ncbi:hypothetical protein P23_3632 [Acinetobacter calcoaceticus]|nr:hypothetical protein P23_3632 [Acinetobacter calcoaceticus]
MIQKKRFFVCEIGGVLQRFEQDLLKEPMAYLLKN